MRPFRWLLLSVVATLVGALIPLVSDDRFYFKGDTQAGAFGQWVHLGRALRAGSWPLLDPSSWRAGNFVSEGQWGLFSPLTMTIAVLASFASSPVVFCTVLKLVLLCGGCVGTFLLVGSFRGSPQAACVAGLAATLGGTTVYLESPSWVTGQMVWALLPFCWWSLRRTARGASPVGALVFAYLIVTVGYVYGTMYLGLVLLAVLLDALLVRDLRAAVRTAVVGVFAVLVAVTVYLPGVLTAPVTVRSGFEILSDGRLQGDLPGLLTSMLPTDQIATGSADYPTHYVAWFLPVLLWLDATRVRLLLRPMAGLLLVLSAAVLWVLGPNAVGPIRWPVRVLPLVVLCTVVLVAVLVDRALAQPLRRGRLAASLVWVGASCYLVLSRQWELRAATLVSTAIVVVGLVTLWLVLRRGPAVAGPQHLRLPTRTAAAAAMTLWCLVVVCVQHSYFPSTPAVNRNMPSRTSAYATAAAAAQGDTMVVGDPEAALIARPEVARDFLVASAWYVGPKQVQSTYTTIGFSAYNSRYCVRYNGSTCKAALSTLFEKEPSTGQRRIDLLSVSSLQIFRPDFSDSRVLAPPSGWHVAHTSANAVTWVRDRPAPSAGGVAWRSPGLATHTIADGARGLRVVVDQVPASGGRLVLSRLAWPGYAVDGVDLAAPPDGYLLTVAVPASAAGREVAITFAPPGWSTERLALGAALALGLTWSVGALLVRRLRLNAAVRPAARA